MAANVRTNYIRQLRPGFQAVVAFEDNGVQVPYDDLYHYFAWRVMHTGSNVIVIEPKPDWDANVNAQRSHNFLLQNNQYEALLNNFPPSEYIARLQDRIQAPDGSGRVFYVLEEFNAYLYYIDPAQFSPVYLHTIFRDLCKGISFLYVHEFNHQALDFRNFVVTSQARGKIVSTLPNYYHDRGQVLFQSFQNLMNIITLIDMPNHLNLVTGFQHLSTISGHANTSYFIPSILRRIDDHPMFNDCERKKNLISEIWHLYNEEAVVTKLRFENTLNTVVLAMDIDQPSWKDHVKNCSLILVAEDKDTGKIPYGKKAKHYFRFIRNAVEHHTAHKPIKKVDEFINLLEGVWPFFLDALFYTASLFG